MADPRLRPDQLTPAQRELYDELCSGPRADPSRPRGPVDADGRLTGPFDAMLHSPPVGGPLQRLGAALRYESALPDDVRESVICLVAGVHASSYERYAHEPLARAAGVAEPVLEVLARGGLPDGAGPELRLAHALLTRAVWAAPVEAQERWVDELGPRAAFEVSTLVGYYTTLAWQLRIFDVEAPDE